MFEKLLDILKTFFEKYFIQALIAIIPTVIIYYVTPEDMNFLKKIGKEVYLLFCFVCCFLIVEFIIYIFKKIKSKTYYNKLSKEQNEKIEMQNLHYLWNFVDSLDENKKNLLKYMLDNKNKAINIQGCLMGNRLLDEWFINTQITSDGLIKSFDIFSVKEKGTVEKGYVVTQYKLREEIYEALIYSRDRYGKISNFQ